VPLLSDWNGEVTRAFGVAIEPLGMKDVAMRSSFLIEDGTSIVEAWTLGPELPDIDEVVATARHLQGDA
jgi:peroxiredoxin